ncbi:transmembrane protein, putative (macronuclear) [Tetrahymena thermophila SB210]|uniref:Transmembrane protein, putative n=1 Tax=Tetrahymena thermophila (strain SB210) TaxID=312017 RepID=W7X9L8_TETTS|nr:transmembrane protein, putative [Tetrahymena thermophila SB210]EWS73098.1 transmembrane protein, putative [Tetrahymena thermophila SB210]|eukprot:XP_012654369.1 transmembrane protein, putative [Tetrahymena thermophila SB210]
MSQLLICSLLIFGFYSKVIQALLCDSKCAYCSSYNTCYQCQPGYTLSSDQLTCQSNCPNQTYYYEATQSCLQDCPQGFEKSQQNKACISVNNCDQVTFLSGSKDFKFNMNSQLYQNLLIVSGQQNQTINENYLKVYQLQNDEYGFYPIGTLEGHNTPIIAFKNLDGEYSQMLISISRNLVIAWDMQYGLLKSSVNLSDNLYVNSNSFYLDQNILVLNYFDSNQFAVFFLKSWVKSLFSQEQNDQTDQFFTFFDRVHQTPIIGYQIQFNNYLISYDNNNMIIKWDINNNYGYEIYQNFNFTINQVFSFPNFQSMQNSDFFIVTFQENTSINIISNNNNTSILAFNTNHTTAISNIFFDISIQVQNYQSLNIVQLISISQTEIIVFQFNINQQSIKAIANFTQSTLFTKLINNQVIIVNQKGLNAFSFQQQQQQSNSTSQLQLLNILPTAISTNDYIGDIQQLNTFSNISYVIVGRLLTIYQSQIQPGNSILAFKQSQQIQSSPKYSQHYGKVNGVVMDTSQNLIISYSSDGSFGIWDIIQNSILNQKPLYFQLPPWCLSLQSCQTSIIYSQVIMNGVLLSLYSNNIFITWNISRYQISQRNTYSLPSQWLSLTNYGFFNNYLFMSNNKELFIYNFNSSETQIVNNNYTQYSENISQIQLGFNSNTFYLLETLTTYNNSSPQYLLRIKFLSNYTVSKNTTIQQQCQELQYFQQTQKVIVNYYSVNLTIVTFPTLTSVSITLDSNIVTQIYSASQNSFLIITASTTMYQYLPSGSTYASNKPANSPLPRKNFGMIYKSQFQVTSSGYTYFQNTGFNQLDNQVFYLLYSNLRICQVFPFKNEISSVSVVNNALAYIGFSDGSFQIGRYSCSTQIYVNDYCNTQNTIFNPYLKKAYLFNLGKVIVVDLYSKSDVVINYGHPTTNSVNVIQDSVNGNMITYSKESTQNLYKFNQKNQTATQFMNGHNATVDYVFLDIQNDVVISHSISLTDLKVIVWSYSYTIQLQVFLNIQQFNQTTPIIGIVSAVFDQNRQQLFVLTLQGTLFTFNYLNYTVKTQFLIQNAQTIYLDSNYNKFYLIYNQYRIQVRNYYTLNLENEIITNSPIPPLQKLSPSNNWLIITSSKLLTVIDRQTQTYKSTILCNTNCGDFKISDKLNLIFSYLRDNSDSIDAYDITNGNYLYSISGQTDLDIGTIKLIVMDDVNYLLFIGKLSSYITVFFNYLTKQYVGYTYENIFLFWGTAMNNQFNALSVADTSTFYIRTIQEQITSTFKFQDQYMLKQIDYYTSSTGDIYFVGGLGYVRRYTTQNQMVKLVGQLSNYIQIVYYNQNVYVLTYTQLLKYSDNFQILPSNSTLNMFGSQIIGTINNQIFVSTFNSTILQIDCQSFQVINTIALPSSLVQSQFVQKYNDLLIITQDGSFIRYNYANKTQVFKLSSTYYYAYYNLNLSLISLVSSTQIEMYTYTINIQNFTNYQLTIVPYSSTLSFVFIDEQYSNLYAVLANDRVIDIFSFQRNPLTPNMNMTKINFIPYINSIFSVQLSIVGSYIKVQIPWSISYYDRQTFNFYWQVQDPKFIQQIRQYIINPSFPELVFTAQNNFITIAYQNIQSQVYNLLLKYQLQYPTIYNITIQKNFDLYMINMLILVSGNIVRYQANIPIVNGIPQQSYFKNCLLQIQNPLAGYQVQNQLSNLQDYFSQFNYQSQGIRLQIYGTSFLYYTPLMQQLNTQVQYFGNQQNSNLNLEANLFSQNQNQQVSLSNQNLILLSKPIVAQFNALTNTFSLQNVSFSQLNQSYQVNTTIKMTNLIQISFINITIQQINLGGQVSLFDIQNCTNVSFQNIQIQNINIQDLVSLFKFQLVSNLNIQNLSIVQINYEYTTRRFLIISQTQQYLFQFYKIANLTLSGFTIQYIKGNSNQSIFDFKQNQNSLLQDIQLNQIVDIQVISYVNYFQDEISTTVEENDIAYLSQINIKDFHSNQNAINYQGSTLQISFSSFDSINCLKCTGSSLQVYQTTNLEIRNTNFTNNSAYNGGSIAIINCQSSSISITNSQFLGNSAQNSGGAIYLSNSYLKLQNDIFESNSALIGGAIRYVGGRPREFNHQYFQANGVQFIQNVAVIHSQNWGSYIQYVKAQQLNLKNFRLLDQQQDKSESKNLQQDIFQINNLQSGGFINLQFQIYDEENNALYYNVTSCQNNQYPKDICDELSQIKLTLLSLDENVVRVVGSYTAQFSQFISSIEGFQIIGIQLIGNPLSSQFIYLQAEGIQQYQPLSSNDIIQKLSSAVYQDKYQLNFRQCEIGEIYKQANQIYLCSECIVGTYSLQTPTKNNSLQCQRCPDQTSYCYKNQMELKAGYWKSTNLTDNIYQCQTKSSCNGDQKTNYCATGHYGPLCQFCDENGVIWQDKFQYDNKNGCTNCTKMSIGYAIGETLIVSLIIVAYCLFNIVQCLKASERVVLAFYMRVLKLSCISRSSQNNEVNMAVKALTYFLQLYKLISNYTLDLPQVVAVAPDIFGSPSSSAVVNNACQVALLSTESMPHLYWRSLMIILSPFGFAIVLFLIYLIFIHKKYNVTIRKSHVICTLIFLFQYTQPNIVQNLVAQVSCQEFDGKKYIIADYTYECYTQQHLSFILFLIGPGLIFHSFIYPLFVFTVLYISRNQLNNATVRLRYGYIYQDYNVRGYYWEIMKYFLKLSLILVLNFYDSPQPKTKFLAVFCVLAIYYILLILVKPYQMKRYQQVDQNSTIALMMVSILNYFLNTDVTQIQIYIFYMLLLLCQLVNGGFLVFLILRVYFEKYVQFILNKLPSSIRNSIYIRFLMSKTDIHSDLVVQKAIKLWMLVYKKSKFYQLKQQQSSFIKKQIKSKFSGALLEPSSSQISPTIIPSHQERAKRFSLKKSNMHHIYYRNQSETEEQLNSHRLLTNPQTLRTQQDKVLKTQSIVDQLKENQQEQESDQIDILSSGSSMKIPNFVAKSNARNSILSQN